MNVLTLADIFEALIGKRPESDTLVISEAAIDSRQVIPACMFVALEGERVDGHEYVGQAFKAGASLALIQKDVPGNFHIIKPQDAFSGDVFSVPDEPFCLMVDDTLKALQTIAKFYRIKLAPRTIAITGSIGKSTTKELTAEVLDQRYRTIKNYGNLNNEIGLPLSLLRLSRGHERAVLEMGFYLPGEISFLCDLAAPQVGIITNVQPVHAERAGSLEVIAEGKAELVKALPADGYAVLNFDDPLVRQMADKTQARVFFYGLSPESDLWADQIEGLGLEGIRFRLHHQNETLHIKTPIIGQHSVHTILRAAAAGLIEGLTWGEIISGLKYGRSQLRLVAVKTHFGATLLDDSYNSSPESALAALNLLFEMAGRKVAVLGDMLELGPYEEQGHAKVGVRVAQICDELIAIGERAKIIADAARKSGMDANKITWAPDVPEAIKIIPNYLKENDVVLIKGSLGMGMARIVTALEAAE